MLRAFFNKSCPHKNVFLTAREKQATIVLSHMTTILHQQNKNYNWLSIINLLSRCNISLGVNTHSNFKDKMKRKWHSVIVANWRSNNSGTGYTGKMKSQSKTQILQHIGVCPMSPNSVKSSSKILAVKGHMLILEGFVFSIDFSIINKGISYHHK